MPAQLKHTLKSGSPGMPEGVRIDAGDTVPTNGVSGFPKGSLFIKTDGGVGTTIYINEGSISSCNFNAIDTTD